MLRQLTSVGDDVRWWLSAHVHNGYEAELWFGAIGSRDERGTWSDLIPTGFVRPLRQAEESYDGEAGPTRLVKVPPDDPDPALPMNQRRT
jgi:hypothetical protein